MKESTAAKVRHSARRHFSQGAQWKAIVKDGRVDINDVRYHSRVVYPAPCNSGVRELFQAEICKLYAANSVRVFDPAAWSAK